MAKRSSSGRFRSTTPQQSRGPGGQFRGFAPNLASGGMIGAGSRDDVIMESMAILELDNSRFMAACQESEAQFAQMTSRMTGTAASTGEFVRSTGMVHASLGRMTGGLRMAAVMGTQMGSALSIIGLKGGEASLAAQGLTTAMRGLYSVGRIAWIADDLTMIAGAGGAAAVSIAAIAAKVAAVGAAIAIGTLGLKDWITWATGGDISGSFVTRNLMRATNLSEGVPEAQAAEAALRARLVAQEKGIRDRLIALRNERRTMEGARPSELESNTRIAAALRLNEKLADKLKVQKGELDEQLRIKKEMAAIDERIAILKGAKSWELEKNPYLRRVLKVEEEVRVRVEREQKIVEESRKARQLAIDEDPYIILRRAVAEADKQLYQRGKIGELLAGMKPTLPSKVYDMLAAQFSMTPENVPGAARGRSVNAMEYMFGFGGGTGGQDHLKTIASDIHYIRGKLDRQRFGAG